MGTSTSTADIDLTDDGIVVVRVRQGATQAPDDARQNLRAAVMVGGGVRRPILVDISRATPLEPDVRRIYAGKLLDAAFVALALLVEASPLGRAMGNVYFALARLSMPTRLFAEEHAARAWLATFIERP